MPSLRNPVGPLPSSIYWRRRLVVLVALAVVLAVLLWLLLSGGGKKTGAGSPVSATHPATSITPGGSSDGSKAGGSSGTAPSGSSGPSGGASASAPAGTNGGTVATGPSGGPGTGGSAGAGGSTGSPGGSSGGSSGGSDGSGGSVAPPNAAGTMNLPACAATDVELALTSAAQTYDSSQWPTFRLAITNTAGAACRIDLGAKSAVLTVTSGGSSTRVWSSGDCPRVTAAQWYAVPAAGTLSRVTFEWTRTTSAPGCVPGGGGGAVGAGTYVATIAIDGVPTKPLLTFKLAPFGS